MNEGIFFSRRTEIQAPNQSMSGGILKQALRASAEKRGRKVAQFGTKVLDKQEEYLVLFK